MPKVAHYTEQERNFVLALALATRRAWTSLTPIIRGLAEHGCLSFLGPKANEKFLHWSHQHGYRWQKRYGWQLCGVEAEDQTPLPTGERIDDQLLRDRLGVEAYFRDRVLNDIGDPYQNALAFHRVAEQIESQNVRRNTPHITTDGLIGIVLFILEKYQGQPVVRDIVISEIASEVKRRAHLSIEADYAHAG